MRFWIKREEEEEEAEKKVFGVLPSRSKLCLNASLCHRRQDPEIETILAAPGQCALYKLDVHLKQWSRLDVEV